MFAMRIKPAVRATTPLRTQSRVISLDSRIHGGNHSTLASKSQVPHIGRPNGRRDSSRLAAAALEMDRLAV